MTRSSEHGRRRKMFPHPSMFPHLFIFLLLKDIRRSDGTLLLKQFPSENSTNGSVAHAYDNCSDSNGSDHHLNGAIVYFVTGLQPSNLHVVFEERTDPCLMDALWRAGTPAQVVGGPNLLKATFGRSTYALAQQYVLIGGMSWITSTITMARERYSAGKMNAMKTKWIWVLSASAESKSFKDVLSEMTKVLTEGMRGILLYITQGIGGRREFYTRSIEIGSMNVRGDGVWQLQPAGTLTAGDERIRVQKPLWPPPPLDLYGRLVRMSIVTKPTVFEYEEGQDPGKAGGYAPDLLRAIERKLNFTKRILLTQGFGTLLANGSWDGMVGVLARREADIAPLDFTPVYSRTLVVDFGLVYSTDNVILISKVPSIFIKPFILLQIFSPFVWACWLFTGIMTGVMITLSSGTETELRYEKGSQQEDATLGKAFKYCWASLTIFVYQGSSWWPRDATSRLLSGVLMLIAIVFGSVYSGSITAFLAIPFRSQPVNSLEDLVATDIKPAFREGASTYNFFVEQTEGVLGKVKARMTSFTAAQVASWEFFRDIARGRYALIDTSSSALGISAGFEKVGRSCLFHPAREPVRLDLDAFAFPKNSPVIYQFDETMRWLRGYGIIQYMKDQYYKKACDTVTYSDQPKPLSVTQAQGAFYVISVGLGVALAAFLLEILVHRCSDSE